MKAIRKILKVLGIVLLALILLIGIETVLIVVTIKVFHF